LTFYHKSVIIHQEQVKQETAREGGTMKQNLTIRTLTAGILLSLAVILYSCGGGYGGNTTYGMTTPPGAFSLSSPANLATSVTATPTLTWTPSTSATDYRVQIDTTGTFTGALVINAVVGATTYSYMVPASTLTLGTPYFWRVIAENVYGQAFAGPRSFTP
jgi:hypothetical protein